MKTLVSDARASFQLISTLSCSRCGHQEQMARRPLAVQGPDLAQTLCSSCHEAFFQMWWRQGALHKSFYDAPADRCGCCNKTEQLTAQIGQLRCCEQCWQPVAAWLCAEPADLGYERQVAQIKLEAQILTPLAAQLLDVPVELGIELASPRKGEMMPALPQVQECSELAPKPTLWRRLLALLR